MAIAMRVAQTTRKGQLASGTGLIRIHRGAVGGCPQLVARVRRGPSSPRDAPLPCPAGRARTLAPGPRVRRRLNVPERR
jgi:hypothetical protein